jgi:hypothetical protein
VHFCTQADRDDDGGAVAKGESTAPLPSQSYHDSTILNPLKHRSLAMFDTSFYLGLVVTALLILVGHWFPWPRRLEKLEAYTYGVCAILVGTFIWLYLATYTMAPMRIWWGLAAYTASAGVATVVSHATDYVLNLVMRERVRGDE